MEMKENRNGGNGKEALKERERRKKGKHINEIWKGYTNESKVEEKGKKKQR